jgi:hypothetical protein
LAADGVVLALLLAAAVDVQSTVPCPSAAEVEARLPPLALQGAPAGARDRAVVSRSGGTLTLALSRADGSAVVERQLDAQGSCSELAEALALMIAVWHAQEHPDVPRPPALQRPAVRPPGAYSVEAGTQLFASLSGGDVSPGALLSARLWRRAWGVALSVSGTALREQPLGRGLAAWTRGAIGLGPARRLLAEPLRLDVWVEGLAGLTVGRGRGYAANDTPAVWTVGGGTGLSISRALGPVTLSLGASGALWPDQQLVVNVAGDRQPLPRVEARVGAGLGLRFDL